MQHNRYPLDIIQRYLRAGATARVAVLLERLPLHDVTAFADELTPTEARIFTELLVAPAQLENTMRNTGRDGLSLLLQRLEDAQLAQVVVKCNGPGTAFIYALLPHDRRQQVQKRARDLTDEYIREQWPVSQFMTSGPVAPSEGLPMVLSSMASGDFLRQYHQQAEARVQLQDSEGRIVGSVSWREVWKGVHGPYLAPEMPRAHPHPANGWLARRRESNWISRFFATMLA